MYIYGNPIWGQIQGDINDQADLIALLSGGGHVIQDEGSPLTQRSNLNFVGAGVTVTDDSGNDATVVTISGGGGGGVWGSITGTLSNQTDLQDALDLKADISSLGAVALSNDYDDLDNLPALDFDPSGTAAAAIAAHEAAGDPHPQYLTAAEADAAYDALGAASAAVAAHEAAGDPHPQYLTSAEGDAAYDALGAAAAAVAAHEADGNPHAQYLTEAEADALYSALGHGHTSSDISDFDSAVSANSDVAANTAARHDPVTVSDTSEIDLSLTGQQISGSIVAGSIDEAKLDTSVNASLDLADSSMQPGDNVSDLVNDAGYLDATPTLQEVVSESEILSSIGIIFNDNIKAKYGTGSDATIYYDGTNMIIDPSEVGAGELLIGPTGNKDVIMGKLGVGGSPISSQAIINGIITATSGRGVLNFVFDLTGAANPVMTNIYSEATYSGTSTSGYQLYAGVFSMIMRGASLAGGSVRGSWFKSGIHNTIAISGNTHNIVGIEIAPTGNGTGGTHSGGTINVYGILQQAIGSFAGSATVTKWGGYFDDRLRTNLGLVLGGDFGAGVASTITLTNNVAGTPSNTTTPTKWLKIYDGTTVRYIPIYT